MRIIGFLLFSPGLPVQHQAVFQPYDQAQPHRWPAHVLDAVRPVRTLQLQTVLANALHRVWHRFKSYVSSVFKQAP